MPAHASSAPDRLLDLNDLLRELVSQGYLTQATAEQCLTIQEALRAHTMGAAYAAHEESIKGSIEPGKLADVVVWPADPYTVPLNELWQTPIDMTIVGGEIVFQR